MRLRFLGTGAAEGIPCFGCTCPRCQAARQGGKNRRRRNAILVEAEDYKLLIDTPPEISNMLQDVEFNDLTAILLSHEHYDHVGGITEFEYWCDRVLHVFAGYDVLPKIQFTPRLATRVLPATFTSHTVLTFGPLQVMPFKVLHHVPCYGFVLRENDRQVVYFSDGDDQMSQFHLRLLEQADVAIFHTPTFDAEEHHISVRELVALLQAHTPGQAVITHINHHNRLHEELEAYLAPYNVVVAYDGMVLEV